MSVRHIATHKRVKSLVWDGDDLVDFVDGPDRWSRDGVADLPPIRRTVDGPFDQAIASPSGRFSGTAPTHGRVPLAPAGQPRWGG